MKPNNKDKILKIVQGQSLSAEKLKYWGMILEDLPEELQLDILKFIEADPANVQRLTENITEKTEALKNQDIQQWENILKKEKNFAISK